MSLGFEVNVLENICQEKITKQKKHNPRVWVWALLVYLFLFMCLGFGCVFVLFYFCFILFVFCCFFSEPDFV